VKKHDVLLNNGQRYYFGKDFDLSKTKKGDKVKITFEEKKMKKGTKNEASAIAPVS
jgi:alanine-alpha-ketoisovalerate/valine-pyruvate aminotransferase